MEHGGLFRSWRFIGLIVARARAPKLLPRKNIFTPRDGTEPERNEPGGGGEEESPGQARRRWLRSRHRKVDGRGRDLRIIARAPEIYRTGRGRGAEGRFPSKAETARSTKTRVSTCEEREEKDRDFEGKGKPVISERNYGAATWLRRQGSSLRVNRERVERIYARAAKELRNKNVKV